VAEFQPQTEALMPLRTSNPRNASVAEDHWSVADGGMKRLMLPAHALPGKLHAVALEAGCEHESPCTRNDVPFTRKRLYRVLSYPMAELSSRTCAMPSRRIRDVFASNVSSPLEFQMSTPPPNVWIIEAS